MTKIGTVSFSNGEPSLDDGTRLALCDKSSPFAAAGTFLRGKGIRDNDTIGVTGDDGQIGGVAVFCITAASPAADAKAPSLTRAPARREVVTKAAPEPKAPAKKAMPVARSKSKAKAEIAKSKRGPATSERRS